MFISSKFTREVHSPLPICTGRLTFLMVLLTHCSPMCHCSLPVQVLYLINSTEDFVNAPCSLFTGGAVWQSVSRPFAAKAHSMQWMLVIIFIFTYCNANLKLGFKGKVQSKTWFSCFDIEIKKKLHWIFHPTMFSIQYIMFIHPKHHSS